MTYCEKLRRHYELFWGAEAEPIFFKKGPIDEILKKSPDFAVLLFRPRASRKMWTLATCGMSSFEQKYPIELHIHSDSYSEDIVEILVSTAYFQLTTGAVDLWDTVNFGKPWLGASACTRGLISLPYLDGPGLENCEISSHAVKFYWMIPITEDEMRYKSENGIEALEVMFERKNFNYLDPLRPSVVSKFTSLRDLD